MTSVLSHNQRAGSTWGSGGEAYEAISNSIADGIDHVVNRVWPKPGERFLDIATGTGWTARRLAARAPDNNRRAEVGRSQELRSPEPRLLSS